MEKSSALEHWPCFNGRKAVMPQTVLPLLGYVMDSEVDSPSHSLNKSQSIDPESVDVDETKVWRARGRSYALAWKACEIAMGVED
jgi:hypothetical protein